MIQNTGRGFILVALLIAACLYSLQDYQQDIKKGIDLEGGTELLYRIPTDLIPADQRSSVAADVKKVISQRFDSYGLKEISVVVSGSDRLLIQLPGFDNDELERLKSQIERAGELNIHLVSAAEYTTADVIAEIETKMVERQQALIGYNSLSVEQRAQQPPPAELDRIVIYRPSGVDGLRGAPVVVENSKTLKVSGSFIQDANSTVDQTGGPAVGFTFGGAGSTLFANLTEDNINRSLAIVLDDVAMSIATINDRIVGAGIISGSFTTQEVDDIVTILRAGSLPAKPKLESQQTVGAVLGKESIDRGTQAMIIGFLLVVVFMLIYYRAAGLVANLALMFNLVLVLTLLVIFRNTLTFPGMAGLLLTVGMAVDANILIFERIREEKDRGKALPAAFQAGFQRAFWTIFDANLTTLVTAFVLFQFGTGAVKGFAVVLSIGIITSFFSSIYVSRLILSALIRSGIIKEMSMARLISKPNIDFMSMRGATRILSIVFVLSGCAFLFWRGSEAMGIDFTGGTKLSISLAKPTTEGELRQLIGSNLEFEDLQVQALGVPGSIETARYALKTRTLGSGAKETEAFKEAIGELLTANDLLAPNALTNPRFETVAGQDGAADTHVFISHLHVIKGTGDDAQAGLTASKMEEELRATGYPVAGVVETDGPGAIVGIVTFEVSSEQQANSNAALALQSTLTKNLKDLAKTKAISLSDPFPEVTSISGRVAENMQGKTFVALMISFMAIVFYISIRFELRFGVAAIAALVHDILFTLGAIAVGDFLIGDVLSLKINLPVVAALLTVVGYSLNDTIVIFDRIRENLVDSRRDVDYVNIVNTSVNQTLSRTILTSVTTFLVVLILLLIGGEALHAFSFALCIGVCVGTYSSIFVASPTLVYLQEKARIRRDLQIAEAGLKK
ncbi:MAG: protein translocase subunit SecD [Planctomycetota bacterium]|nr:protein translocase subunit SecD [Planctomycetota bacterium]